MNRKMIPLLAASVSAVSHAGAETLSGALPVISLYGLRVAAAEAAFVFAFVALIAHTILWAIRRWKLDDSRWKLDLVFRILRILFALGAIVMALLFFMAPYLLCGSMDCGSLDSIGSTDCLNYG